MVDPQKGSWSNIQVVLAVFFMESYAKLLVCLKDRELEFILNKQNMTIGRGINQSIVINEPTISRLHARIFLRDTSYFLEDLSTFQKTYLNKAPIQIPMNLNHRDLIQLGNVKALFLTSPLPENDEILQEARCSNQENEEKKIKNEENNDTSDNENIKKATLYLKADIKEILEDEEEVEVQDSPLAVGESLDMPFSEIPFANVVTYAKSTSTVKSKVTDAQLICENTQQVLTINKEAVYIGLDSINEMQVNDPYFSKVHFAIMFNRKSSKHYLKNMGDKEVRCNGVPIENMHELGSYAVVNTGQYKFHFFAGTQDVVDFQKTMVEENENFSVRFFPELPTDTVILDSSTLQIKGEYTVIGSEKELSATLFFTKNMDGDKYVFNGEIHGDKDDLPSLDLNQYIIKLQGVFETIIEYESLPIQIMSDFNKIIYSKFKGIQVIGTLIMFHRDTITWIGDGMCAPIFYSSGATSFLPSRGMALGVHEKFVGYEEQVSWKVGDKILFFTKNILSCCLKGQTLLVSSDSLKRLFHKKVDEENEFTIKVFSDDLVSKLDMKEQVLFTLFVRADVS